MFRTDNTSIVGNFNYIMKLYNDSFKVGLGGGHSTAGEVVGILESHRIVLNVVKCLLNPIRKILLYISPIAF